MRRRVVITGLGVIAPNGVGKRAFWDALKDGRSGIRRITRFNPEIFPTQFAGEADFDPTKFISAKQMRRMDRTSHLAVSAAKMGIEDAGLNIQKEDPERIGVMIGTAMAGHGMILEQHKVFMEKGPMRIGTFTAIASFPDAPSSQISIELGINGPSFSIATACSSASDAMGYAFNAIRNKELDIIIMGGSDAPSSQISIEKLGPLMPSSIEIWLDGASGKDAIAVNVPILIGPFSINTLCCSSIIPWPAIAVPIITPIRSGSSFCMFKPESSIPILAAETAR